LKEGVIFAFTVTVLVTDVAHCPALGVNVYVVVPAVAVLMAAFHDPVMPLIDVVGN
jgi:hypothetical protein